VSIWEESTVMSEQNCPDRRPRASERLRRVV
jgi:hypothetical protein